MRWGRRGRRRGVLLSEKESENQIAISEAGGRFSQNP